MTTEGGDTIMYNLVHYEDDSYPLLQLSTKVQRHSRNLLTDSAAGQKN